MAEQQTSRFSNFPYWTDQPEIWTSPFYLVCRLALNPFSSLPSHPDTKRAVESKGWFPPLTPPPSQVPNPKFRKKGGRSSSSFFHRRRRCIGREGEAKKWNSKLGGKMGSELFFSGETGAFGFKKFEVLLVERMHNASINTYSFNTLVFQNFIFWQHNHRFPAHIASYCFQSSSPSSSSTSNPRQFGGPMKWKRKF